MRELKADKANRYLVEGRVILRSVERRRIIAIVRGEGAVYRVRHTGTRWDCTCPAKARCVHVLAVGRVTAIDGD